MLVLRSQTALSVRYLAALTTQRGYCKDYSSSDDEKDSKNQAKKAKSAEADKSSDTAASQTESAATRLNRLLASMQTDNLAGGAQKLDLARPGTAHAKRREAVKEEAAAKDVFVAAKRVAALLGEEQQQQTESELLAKLLGREPATEPGTTTNENAATGKAPENELSLSELIVGMKIDRTQRPPEQSRGEFVRRAMAGRRPQQQDGDRDRDRAAAPTGKRQAETYTGSVNLYGATPLGIFKEASQLRDSPDILGTWAHLQQHELQLQAAHPPANYFEKIANWTEQGKVWRFPIDNEQDWSEEVDVDFSEHIFLEQHLEPWCPHKGPVRHFMELVCVGLSKNPYITAKEKKEHILWYRDYFEAKKDILKDLMSKEKLEQASKNKLEA